MRAGKLRHRVDVETFTSSTGDRGQEQGSWGALYSNVFASIETLNGREREQAQQLIAEADTKVVLRYHSGISTEDRITFNNRIFNIGHINNIDQRNIELVLTCTEVL